MQKTIYPYYPISIHALREEGDLWIMGFFLHSRISIHALREEGDTLSVSGKAADAAFLSTPSARRATNLFSGDKLQALYFYPRPPRGGRPILAENPHES